MTTTDELDRVFAALADATRRDILGRLGAGDATVGELAEPYDISLPAISRHLRVLQEAGLVTRTAHAQWRTNHLRTEPLDAARGWIDHVTHLWEGRLGRLDTYLKEKKR